MPENNNFEKLRDLLNKLFAIAFNDAFSLDFNLISSKTLIINISGNYSFLFTNNYRLQKDLQKIIRLLYVNNQDSKDVNTLKIILDVENRKARNIEALKYLAKESAEKALLLKRNISLHYMNAFDRYIIHDFIAQNFPQLTTKSVGKEPKRKVVITLKSAIE